MYKFSHFVYMIRSLICLVFGHKRWKTEYLDDDWYQERLVDYCLRCYKTNLPMPKPLPQ